VSRHVETNAAATVSPKVTAGAYVGAALTVLGTAAAAALTAVPREAWDGLGVWGVPVGIFVGTLGTGLAAYVKRDWLRDVGAQKVEEETAEAEALSEAIARTPVPEAPGPVSLPDPESIPTGEVDADGFTPEDRAALAALSDEPRGEVS